MNNAFLAHQTFVDRQFLSLQRSTADAFRALVVGSGLRHAEVTAIIGEAQGYVPQLCGPNSFAKVPLYKTMDMALKVGIDVEISITASRDGKVLHKTRKLSRSNFGSGAEMMRQLRIDVSPALLAMIKRAGEKKSEFARRHGIEPGQLSAMFSESSLTKALLPRMLNLLEAEGLSVEIYGSLAAIDGANPLATWQATAAKARRTRRSAPVRTAQQPTQPKVEAPALALAPAPAPAPAAQAQLALSSQPRLDNQEVMRRYESIRIERVRQDLAKQADRFVRERAELMGAPFNSLADLIKEGEPVPRYMHPHDPNLTWCGNGNVPSWLHALVEQGHDMNQYQIPL